MGLEHACEDMMLPPHIENRIAIIVLNHDSMEHDEMGRGLENSGEFSTICL